MAKKKTAKKASRVKIIEQPSGAEWKVLSVLWNRGPVSVSQIRTSLKNEWTLGAIRSFLKRLVDKKLVRLLDDESIYRFEAVHDRETLLCEKSRKFLKQYFNGSFQKFAECYQGDQKSRRKKSTN